MVGGTILRDPYGAVVESILPGRLEAKEGIVSGVGAGGNVGAHPLPYVGIEAADDATLAK
jgi:hypothetical protein